MDFLNFNKGKVYLEEGNLLVVDLDPNVTITDKDISHFYALFRKFTSGISGKFYLLILLENIKMISRSAFLIRKFLPKINELGANAFVVKPPMNNSTLQLYIDILKSPDKKSMMFEGEEDARIWLNYKREIISKESN